jgi:ATP-dependent protease HslVU (ClpYQ) peptidase subunit
MYGGGGEMHHGYKALIGFAGSHGDALELLQFAEEILDEMAPLVDVAINP